MAYVRVLTSIYLVLIVGLLWALWRTDLGGSGRLRLIGGITVAQVTAVIALASGGRRLDRAAIMVVAFPLVAGGLVEWAVRRWRFRGSVNLVLLAVLLFAVGLVTLFSLNASAPSRLARILAQERLSVAMSQGIIGLAALGLILPLLMSGGLKALLRWAEAIPFVCWCGIATALLAFPKLVGLSPAATRATLAELLLKLGFPFAFAAFMGRQRGELADRTNGGRCLITLAAGMAVPLFALAYFQREQGTGLVLVLAMVALAAYATRSWPVVPLGCGAVAGLVFIGCLVSVSIAQRVIGGWWDFPKYIDKPYPGGMPDLAPGYQLFSSLRSIRASGLWGAGIGHGAGATVPEASTDFILCHLQSELGVIGLAFFSAALILPIREAFRNRDEGEPLALSLALVFLCQGYYVALATLGVVPLTGVPTPFFSLGGAAALLNFAGLAMMTALTGEAERERDA